MCLPCYRQAWGIRTGYDNSTGPRKFNYKLGPQHIKKLLIAQGYNCPICHLPLGDKFDIDHDHKTGDVRGAVHHRCNVMAGYVETVAVPIGLAQVLDYLANAAAFCKQVLA